MTIDRTALRRLVDAEPDDERQCAKCHATMSFEPETEPSSLCHRCIYEVAETIPDLLDDLDAKDRRIAELETAQDQADEERAELQTAVARLHLDYGSRVADLELRLSIATERNVGDRKRIAGLEAGLATIRADLLSLKAHNNGASPTTCERIMQKVDELLPSEGK